MSSSSFIVELARARALPEVWRSRAGEWSRYGLDPQARMLEVVAGDLHAVLLPMLRLSVGLTVAKELTGTSVRQLQRDFPLAAPGNTGRKWKPELALGALLDRYAVGAISEDRTLRLDRAA